MSEIRRIALCTGGGDAPGLNAVLRAAVVSALNRGWECLGIRDGFNGLLNPGEYGGQGVIQMGREAVRGITHLGGTILGTTNKGNPLKFPMQGPDGNWTEVDRGDEVVGGLRDLGVDALISVGGDGSLAIAHALAQRGVRVVGVPKTIDNDLEGTVATFGFDTAVEFATECLDRLHSTAAAHGRVIVVEVMGRYAGWIALHAGVAGTADVILIPEIPYDMQKVADKIRDRHDREKKAFSIVIVAAGGTVSVVGREPGRLERLGGAGEKVAAEVQAMTGLETRCVVLGHLLRGGSPTSMDRLLSLRFGSAAVRALAEGMTDVMVALDPPLVRYVPLERCVSRMKRVPLDGDTVVTARDLGVSFGD
jgi:6-phosphofructokinase 1